MAVNYPKGIKKNAPTTGTSKTSFSLENKNKQASLSHSRRGMQLESAINHANEKYLNEGVASIHKKPTPITLVKVDYPSRSAAKITEAYFKQSSTTDYNGVFQGYYLDFDAKETTQKTSFPLKNFHQHQIDHLQSIVQQKGIGFVIIGFKELSRYFVYPAKQLITVWKKGLDKQGRHSISLQEIIENGFEITFTNQLNFNYLSAVQQFINSEK